MKCILYIYICVHGTRYDIYSYMIHVGLRPVAYRLYLLDLKVRLRWFGADLVKLQYLCHLSWDLNVLYVK